MPRTMARIVVDPRDASQDYWLPVMVAYGLYKDGELAQDITNFQVGVPTYTDPTGTFRELMKTIPLKGER